MCKQKWLSFIKTLTSEVLRQEFCVLVSCCHAGQAQREADRIVDLGLKEGGIPQDGHAVEEDTNGIAVSASKDKSKSGCRDLDLCVKRS